MTTKSMHEDAANSNPVQVTEVLGSGAEAHRLAMVEDWTFVVRESDRDHEPLIPDDVLAERLGAPENDVRALIRRNVEAGHITALSNRRTVRRFTRGGKNRGEMLVDGFLLPEASALFVVTRSDTPKAVELTKEMIRVYMLVRRGLAPAPAPQALDPAAAAALALVPGLVAQIKAHRADVAALHAELGALRTELATGVVGHEVADREILTPLRQISLLYGGTPGEARRHRRRLENKLRSFLGFAGPGSGWAFLPRTSLAFAQRLLAPWMADAVEVGAKRSLASQQPDLFGLHEPGRPLRGTRSPAN
jgi:hypothetical protein